MINTCTVCGRQFKTARSSVLCCSPACSDKYHQTYMLAYLRKRSGIVAIQKICRVCGQTFETGGNRVCCSKACSIVYAETAGRKKKSGSASLFSKVVARDKKRREFFAKLDADYAAWQKANGVTDEIIDTGRKIVEIRGQRRIASTCGRQMSIVDQMRARLLGPSN